VDADLDTLLTALYVELDDRIIPAHQRRRRGPGRPPVVTDAELVCLAVAQALLRFHDERHWIRAAAGRVGHLFPRLLSRSQYGDRLKQAAPLLEAAMRWLAAATPATAEPLRLLDGTPIGCGQSKLTTNRSNLFGWAGIGYDSSHSRWYWGVKLMLITTVDGTVTGFALANPKLVGERAQARAMLTDQPANPRPARSWSLTRDCPASRTTTSSPTWTCTCSARPTATNAVPGRSPAGYANASKRSSGPSNTNSAWRPDPAEPQSGSGPGSCNASWPSTRSSGTTGPSAHPSNAH
jgi:hypothetical protein